MHSKILCAFFFLAGCMVAVGQNIDTAWVRLYNGTGDGDDFGGFMAVDPYGNVYVTGSSVGTSGTADMLTIKYNSAGDLLWERRYNGPADGLDEGRAIAVDGYGYVYVTGYSEGVGTGLDYVTIRYDAYGTELWVRRFNGSANADDKALDMAIDVNGNVFVVGYAVMSTYPDYTTIKYTSAGVQSWVQVYNGPGNYWDLPYVLTLDNL